MNSWMEHIKKTNASFTTIAEVSYSFELSVQHSTGFVKAGHLYNGNCLSNGTLLLKENNAYPYNIIT
jgi:hypothetical protein